MSWVHTLSRRLNRGVEITTGILAMLMALVTGLQVFFRYVLNHSLFWSEEVGRILLVWITFLGATVAYRRKAHVGIDVVVRRLGPDIQRNLERLLLAASCLFFLVLITFGVQFIGFIAHQKTPALGLPMGVPYMVIPLSGVIFCIHAASLGLERRTSAFTNEGHSA
ncbi:TRAP transporter small permease [Desulfosoma caldarium]|uniref:TRAP-type C4-dicarboxylate transport system permease small subunit n=1 Tax=Desulfosoma caldarium TaxID=610254 RepID=A0A3N1UEK9_9BACT|nr:TRAP transporter small permease [Desulfosoma caldarium]ROQ89842.1 TRAP-type C4-dicarboxylate transport system permease small subunit [Desulfosoma caldarium]